MKLLFEDDLDLEFSKSWFLVPGSAVLISDISYSISIITIFLLHFFNVFSISKIFDITFTYGQHLDLKKLHRMEWCCIWMTFFYPTINSWQ